MSFDDPVNPAEEPASGDFELPRPVDGSSESMEGQTPESIGTGGLAEPSQAATELSPVRGDDFGRLHPMSLVFDGLSNLRSMLIPALFAFFSAAQGSRIGLPLAAGIFVLTVGHSIFHYLSLRFRVFEGELVVRQGFLFRRVRTVPVKRIQNIDLIQNLLHRLFGVAEVRIETASGNKPEATLRVLSMAKIEQLRDEIAGQATQTVATSPAKDVFSGAMESNETSLQNADAEDESATAPFQRDLLSHAGQAKQDGTATEQLLHSISPLLLAKAGLASDRGLILLGVLVGLYFQFDLEDKFDPRMLLDFMPQQMNTVMMVISFAIFSIALFLLLRIVGVIWYLLRFYDYRLTKKGDDLRISCGLFTKVSATVPRRRIQFISIHRSLMMRWMGLTSLRVETAGGGGGAGEDQDAAKSVSSRWFIPVLRDEQLADLIAALRPGLKWSPEEYDWQPLSPRAASRMSRLAVIGSLLLAAVGLAISRPWGWCVGIALSPLFVLYAMKKSRATRYASTNQGVVYRSGVLTKKTSLTFFEKIQALRVEQSPFDRRWKMATLSIDTAGAGPADHKIQIPYLSDEFASAEFLRLQNEAASHKPVFG